MDGFVLPPGLVRPRGETPASAPDTVLLITDLHHLNVLASERCVHASIGWRPFPGPAAARLAP